MIIDTSALVAVLDQEPEAERIARSLVSAPERVLSAANLVEVGIVVQARRGDDGARDLDLLLAKLRVDIAESTASQAMLPARQRHAANLNFGDCFAYVLAKDKSAALLFKGDDFGQTDVKVASY
jgi:ribonuclease VapC